MNEQMKQMLHLQWKASRWPLLPFALLCVGLPIMAVGGALAILDRPYIDPAYHAAGMLSALDGWSWIFSVLSAVTGAAAALTAWQLDHRVNHVYSLSLPLSRARYALLKYGAGLTAVVLLSALVLVGALFATTVYTIPEGLTAYPFSFGVRFLFGALLCYSILFAAAAGTMRTTIYVIAALIVVFALGPVWVDLIDSMFDVRMAAPTDILLDALTEWPGPFRVFGGNWMLIDV
jgi:hypothetical protein